MNPLPAYTWDQAQILNLWSPQAFTAIGIKPATIRQWARRGHITPAGRGPNGCRLYPYDQVARHADRHTPQPLEHQPPNCHTVGQVVPLCPDGMCGDSSHLSGPNVGRR